MAGDVCAIKDCGGARHLRGWCNRHYKRWQRHGDPQGGGTAIGAPHAYLDEALRTASGDECMLWPFAQNGVGYGIVTYNSRNKLVTREVCERTYGPAPSRSHHAAHTCGNGHLGCFNPRHVRWATPEENNRDKIEHGTSLRGSKHNMAKLTDEDVAEIRRLRASGWKQEQLAQKFGIKQPTVSNILSGRSWGWLTTTENSQ